MRNIIQANTNSLGCKQAQIQSAGLSRPIPAIRPNPLWHQFQSSVVRAFVRRQRREALRARMIERALARRNDNHE